MAAPTDVTIKNLAGEWVMVRPYCVKYNQYTEKT